MQPFVHKFESLLNPRHQWVVPVYQRHYEWQTAIDKQIPKLWEDLLDQATRRVEGQKLHPHYFGALICSKGEIARHGAVPYSYLIDGQQRITTFKLLLTAIREVARDCKIARLFSATNAYLKNDKNDNMQDPERECQKLWPSHYDRPLYLDIVNKSMDELRSQGKFFYKNGNLTGGAPKLLEAYWYFYKKITWFVGESEEDKKESIARESAETLLDVLLDSFLKGFQIVVIELGEDDDAQEIFGSLNGLVEELSPFDLIRNFIFHRAHNTKEDPDHLFEHHWSEFENDFWTQHVRQGRYRRARADLLIAHSVVAETGREINIFDIAIEYERYSREAKYANVKNELAVLRQHADTYRALEESPPGHPTMEIARVFRIWDMSTFHPMILWINRHIDNVKHQKRLYDLIESYLIRREICGLSRKNYNKVVAMLIQHVKNEQDKFNSMIRHITLLTGRASRFPSNEEVGQAIMHLPIYNYNSGGANRISYILEKIEHHNRSSLNEPIGDLDELTVEHIMPQQWAKHWPLPNSVKVPYISSFRLISEKIDVDDETLELVAKRNIAIQTLGNLTIVTRALNSKLQNAPWEEKRQQFANSSLMLNKHLAEQQTWDESCIEKRSHEFATIINQLWKPPSI